MGQIPLPDILLDRTAALHMPRHENEAQVRGILEKRGVWHARVGVTSRDASLLVEGIRENGAAAGEGERTPRFITIEIARAELESAWREGATEVMT